VVVKVVNIIELVNYLLFLDQEKARVDGEDAAPDMTPLKMQKLLYYCQGYSLGIYNEPLFAESIQAWDHGPVVRIIYNTFQHLRDSCIPFIGKEESNLDEQAKKIARIVMQDKGRFSAWALRDMTHNEKPWVHTYANLGRNSVITEEIMQEFFAHCFEKELPPEEEEFMFLKAGTPPTPREWAEINQYVTHL
jgi:uncharacterized phage-associated protein